MSKQRALICIMKIKCYWKRLADHVLDVIKISRKGYCLQTSTKTTERNTEILISDILQTPSLIDRLFTCQRLNLLKARCRLKYFDFFSEMTICLSCRIAWLKVHIWLKLLTISTHAPIADHYISFSTRIVNISF